MVAPPSSVWMVDADGRDVQVAPDQVQGLLAQGTATFREDQVVPVQTAKGVVEMGARDALAYLGGAEGQTQGGVSSAAGVREQQRRDELGGVGGQLEAAGYGAARGLTLGLSDVALGEIGGSATRERLDDLRRINPNATLLGEGAGMLAPLAVSGGSSLFARGATALPRAVMGAGRAVEGAIAGEALATRLAATAAQGAVEGSLYSLGQQVSESAIRDVPLTAERVVAAMGHGALLGGAIGGGASALGAVARGAASKAGEALPGLLGQTEARAGQLGEDLAASVTPKSEGAVMGLVDRYGREQAIKSSGANLRMVEKLQGMGQEIEDRVIRKLLDEAPEVLGKKPGALLNATEKAAAAERIVQQDGAKIGQMIDDLSAAGVKADVASLVAQQRQRAVAELASATSPDAQKAASKIEDWYASIEKKLGAEGDVKTLWEARRELRKDIDWKKPTDAGDRYNNWKRDLYRAMGDEIEAVGARSGTEMGPDFAARWQNANRDYRAALWLEEATAKGAGREGANRVLGLSEQLGALGGLASGGVAGLPLALVGAGVQHLVKRYGSDVAARVARAVTSGEAVHALDTTMERIAGEKVAGLVGAGRRAVSELPDVAPGVGVAVERAVRQEQPAGEARGSVTARYKAAVEETTTGLETRAQRLTAATEGLDGVAPGLAKAVQQRVMAAQDFLLEKMPKVAQRASLQPHLERERLPSFEEQARFVRYARAVSDPLSVLDDARSGKLRAEGVEALRAVYPTIYEGLRAQVMGAVAEKTSRLTYEQQIQLGRLFPDVPTHPSLEPEAIASYQAAQYRAPSPFTPPQGNPRAPRPSPVPLRPPSLALRSDSLGATA